MTTDAVQAVVSALQVLYTNPDAAAKEKADAWLGEFQKSNEAWSTAQLILFAPDAPVEPKLFAAQTFRKKITYDLEQLPPAQRLPLRDSLITALRQFASGPRVILTQLCIALADLALQLPSSEWADPTSSVVELFGKDPAMAGALLEFLQVIAEEYANNFKLDVKSEFGRRGKDTVAMEGSRETGQVVGLLSMYLQAPGITIALQNQCFACLGAWLRTGQATASSVAGSPILSSLFSALASDELFDNAIDCLVDLIHETQELDENVAIIQDLVPRLTALQPSVVNPGTREDEDKMRGYCRLLVEAGEWYAPLIIAHLDSFVPLVQAIADCASCEHLDVVGITLNFWYRLAKATRSSRDDPAYKPLLDIFANLVGTIIRHLHYPYDESSLVGQERDDFRNFRHTIGDTLKDCCAVLGATNCLRRSYDIISETLKQPGEHKWQDLEAPLFSMRSMGAEVDPQDQAVLPLIMDLFPNLPPQPKIRYAAILVIGRYTEWIDLHPEYIQFLLPYISSGLEDSDIEVTAAAAQTMKYLCKDCSHHLVPFLDQLHSFVQSVSSKLGAEDLLDISAAIAHIIAAMPPADAPQALSTFCMPNVKLLHSLTTQTTPPTKANIQEACDALSRLDMFLAIVDHIPDGLPPSCAGTCEQIWLVLDAFLVEFYSDPVVAEKSCVAIRRGMQFFDEDAAKIAPRVLERLTDCFEKRPASSYIWITGKMVCMYSRREDPVLQASISNAFERESTKVLAMLQTNPPAQLADILDDYVHLLTDVVEFAPSVLFLSPCFPAAFQSLLSALTLFTPAIVLSALDALRSILGHESLQPTPPPHPPIYPPEFSTNIHAAVNATSTQLVSILVSGLVDGVEDQSTNVLTVLRIMSIMFPGQLAAAVPPALEQLPEKLATSADKNEFMTRFQRAIQNQNPNQVKDAFTWFLRATRKMAKAIVKNQNNPTSAPKHEPHWMIVTWFAVSTLVVFWDAGFCLLRPHSMVGGKWQWIWKPYALYETVDLVYGPGALKSGDGFTSAQAILNLFENALNMTYLFLASKKSPVAILVGYSAVLLTLWKTVLYWLMDQQCGWCQTGHNSTFNWWLLFAIPNGLWIAVPFAIAFVFGSELATGLRVGAKAKVL